MKITDEHPEDERIDADLSQVFARQLRVSLLAEQIAADLYTARIAWLSDGSKPWSALTPQQRLRSRTEIDRLIRLAPDVPR